MKHVIYYTLKEFSVRFFESEKLAKWDKDNEREGWGEPIRKLEIESEGPIRISDVKTKESYFLDLRQEDEVEDKLEKFTKDFFPNGLPTFTVKQGPVHPKMRFPNVEVYVGENLVRFIYTDKSAEDVEKELNSLNQ